ncbi:MAG: flavin reductase, partial [Acidimicrobiaceae bacterium]|nr:flavin reductase [Acidimicrobiaceae bacterium]
MNFSVVTRLLDPSVYVVTADDGSRRSGCLISFASQCSIHPPRFLVCLSVLNRTERVARHAPALAVHLLGGDDHPLATHFGGLTGDETDKFAGVAWHRGKLGTPVLDDLPAAFEGLVLERHVLGDHVGYVLDPEAEEAHVRAAGLEQLRQREVSDIVPGHP